MNRTTLSAFAMTGMLAVAACKDPAARVTHAAVGAAAAPTAAPTAANVEHLAFTQAGSRVQFVASKVTRSHDGQFGQFAGTIDFAPDRVETSRIHLDIEMSSLGTDTEQLTQHLRTPDFFDVARFPRATFESTAIRAGGAAGASHTITGNLTLHGQTHAITFPASVTASPEAVVATSEFSIDRRDFGLVYPGMANDLIRDNVVIRLNIRAPRAAQQ